MSLCDVDISQSWTNPAALYSRHSPCFWTWDRRAPGSPPPRHVPRSLESAWRSASSSRTRRNRPDYKRLSGVTLLSVALINTVALQLILYTSTRQSIMNKIFVLYDRKSEQKMNSLINSPDERTISNMYYDRVVKWRLVLPKRSLVGFRGRHRIAKV